MTRWKESMNEEFDSLHDNKTWELDVKSSFLHGDLKEEIYMKQAEGFIEGPSLVCILRK